MNENLFGTDGIRTSIGQEPFTNTSLHKLGTAIGLWIADKYGPDAVVLLAHDTRNSCSWVKASLQSGLLLHKISIVDAQVLPTPAVSLLMQDTKKFSCGIVISASHNPYHDNGIKVIDAFTGKISQHDELVISQAFRKNLHLSALGPFGSVTPWPRASHYYIRRILQHFNAGLLTGKKIVLDCAHGATSALAPRIFKALGTTVITINNKPNGININDHCGALHLEQLQTAVVKHQAFVGFAFDGDGDRVIAVNHRGDIKNGDDIMALLIQHKKYSPSPVVVGTVMANHGFEHYLQQHHKQLIRVPVGDKYVAERLEQEHLLIGGEQSGHIILRDYLSTGDGMFAAIRLLEVMLATHNDDITTFERYPQVLVNLPVKEKRDLSLKPMADLIAQAQSTLVSGRLLVRYSGTEPLLRIMTEAPSYDEARLIANTLSEQLAHVLS